VETPNEPERHRSPSDPLEVPLPHSGGDTASCGLSERLRAIREEGRSLRSRLDTRLRGEGWVPDPDPVLCAFTQGLRARHWKRVRKPYTYRKQPRRTFLRKRREYLRKYNPGYFERWVSTRDKSWGYWRYRYQQRWMWDRGDWVKLFDELNLSRTVYAIRSYNNIYDKYNTIIVDIGNSNKILYDGKEYYLKELGYIL